MGRSKHRELRRGGGGGGETKAEDTEVVEFVAIEEGKEEVLEERGRGEEGQIRGEGAGG